jgi:hypothetical protein
MTITMTTKIFVREVQGEYVLTNGDNPDDIEMVPKAVELELLERIENLHRDIRVAKVRCQIDG